MPVGGMDSPGHDGYPVGCSNAGVQSSLQLNSSALCFGRGTPQGFDGVCAELRQKDSDEIETRFTRSDRYKTELCRQFSESGSCRYGDKCQFAHGGAELRGVARHPKYKTNLCRTFHSTGFCPYGARCHFIHGEPSSASNPAVVTDSGLKAVRWMVPKQNSDPLDSVGILADRGMSMYDSGMSMYDSGMSMYDSVEVEGLICGIRGLMDCSVKGSSLHLIHENFVQVLPSQRQFQCLSPNLLSSSLEGWPSTLYGTDGMGSTSVTPSLSCSDSPTPSPTSALSDVDIWKSLANVIGVGV